LSATGKGKTGRESESELLYLRFVRCSRAVEAVGAVEDLTLRGVACSRSQ
jgi:hypothetical protein